VAVIADQRYLAVPIYVTRWGRILFTKALKAAARSQRPSIRSAQRPRSTTWVHWKGTSSSCRNLVGLRLRRR